MGAVAIYAVCRALTFHGQFRVVRAYESEEIAQEKCAAYARENHGLGERWFVQECVLHAEREHAPR